MTVLAFSDLMAALSAELGRLSATTERMHDLVCLEPEASGRVDARFVSEAQSIDRTVQVLDDLARFLSELAGEQTDRFGLQAEQAIRSLRLAELRHRLAPAMPGTPLATAASGECELF